MIYLKSIFCFILAGLLEIGGGYLLWIWLRESKSWIYGLSGNDQTPIACDLSAINPEELNDHKQNGEQVFAHVEEIRELSDGYALRLPAKTTLIKQAGTFIARERLCCPFFHFTLEVTPVHGPVWLKLTGSENVKQFVAHNVLPQLEIGKSI